MFEFSKAQVKRAGKILRTHQLEASGVPDDRVEWARHVARRWRGSHTEAGSWAQTGCRSQIEALGLAGDVAQRLKELPTIVSKLVRERGRVQLSTMEDIVGARAVVDDIACVRRLEERWLATIPVRRHRDYIETPAGSGYRGVHLVLEHYGRLVEIQLRTRIQHRWAELVEQLGHEFGFALKNQEGPRALLGMLAELSHELARVESSTGPYPLTVHQADAAVARVRAAARRTETW